MQGVGCADVLLYFKCPTTNQMRCPVNAYIPFTRGPANRKDIHREGMMTFFEFLTAVGESRYRNLLEKVDTFAPLSEAFHLHLIDLLRRYYFVGGMPEAVKYSAEKVNGVCSI